MLGAGRRDTRVLFQSKVEGAGKDAAGQREDLGWVTYAGRWALVEALQGKELEFARQQIATATHRITVPAAALEGVVKPTDRVAVGTRAVPMEIGSVLLRGGLHEELVILATERAG